MAAMSDIKVLSTHAVYEVLGELAPAFEHESGHRLSFSYNPTAAIRREIDDGASFDVAIVTRPAIDELAVQGMILRETCADLARCGLGISVRNGAPKPDIGTVDAFRRTLLAAKSVVRSRDGASGKTFEALMDRLGIVDAMRDKIIVGPAGRIAELVARGEGELAVQQVPELVPVKGADFVGPWPDELQVYTVFAAGVATASKHRQAATAFVEALAAPSAAALYKAKGLESIV
ncbi:MAG TPA: substrate-binding domain-containing protein [Pseudolabrys sp.]|jgi:molybdate transport system substrate-binding protein